jgi:hypothetical protein
MGVVCRSCRGSAASKSSYMSYPLADVNGGRGSGVACRVAVGIYSTRVHLVRRPPLDTLRLLSPHDVQQPHNHSQTCVLPPQLSARRESAGLAARANAKDTSRQPRRERQTKNQQNLFQHPPHMSHMCRHHHRLRMYHQCASRPTTRRPPQRGLLLSMRF